MHPPLARRPKPLLGVVGGDLDAHLALDAMRAHNAAELNELALRSCGKGGQKLALIDLYGQ